jgi:hypothetical protein
MSDYGFLWPVFWEFWNSKIDKQSGDTERPAKLAQLEAALGRQWKENEFYEEFIAPYQKFPFGPNELQMVAEIQSEWVHAGIFQFQVRTQAVAETALNWTFVNVINLAINGLSVWPSFQNLPISRSEREKFNKQLRKDYPLESLLKAPPGSDFPPFGQCHFCGSTLENRKASSKFCHWDSCLTESRTPSDHKHQNASCCHFEWINTKRNFLDKIKRCEMDKDKIIKHFQKFLEKRYVANKENYPFMPPKGSLVAEAFNPVDFAYRALSESQVSKPETVPVDHPF